VVTPAPSAEPRPQPSDPVLALAGSLSNTEGDAAGNDSQLLPRPARATRIYSGVLDPDTELRVFTVQDEPVEALASYEKTLEASGFERVPSSSDESRRAFARRGVRAFVTVSRGSTGTLLSIVELVAHET
jgi:hypothetical protein